MNKFINKEIYYSIAILFLPMIVVFGIYFYSMKSNTEIPFYENQTASVIQSDFFSNPFEKLELEAKSVIVQNLTTGEILFEKNSNIAAPLASITKLMTALVLYENLENLNIHVSIPFEAIMVYGNTELRVGEVFILKDLINLMLLSSSNHGAVATSMAFENIYPEKNFINEMNRIAKKIGMKNTYFLNETGLDENLYTAGSFGSARDVSILLDYIIRNYPELIETTAVTNYRVTSITGFQHSINNTNIAIPSLPITIASKTGFTDLAGGNLAVVVDPGLNSPISIVVLGSTRQGRFTDVINLAETIY